MLSDPLSKSVGENKDAENSIEFYDANKHITPSQATYDSFWTTVVLMNPKFKDYAFKRWLRDKNDKAKIKKDLANHFFVVAIEIGKHDMQFLVCGGLAT